jgi:hypothetical protein
MSFEKLLNKIQETTDYDSTKDTEKHRVRVAELLNTVVEELQKRAEKHDLSKFNPPEKEAFDEATPKLKNLVYGSEEYKSSLRSIEPAIKHHYSVNRHHPEHFENGISGMSLIDLVEMLADWKASSERHETGDIESSMQVNKQRFEIDSQLTSVLQNTIKDLGW